MKMSCRSFLSACFTLYSSLCFFFKKKKEEEEVESSPQPVQPSSASLCTQMVTCPGLEACASGADAHACQTQPTPGSRRHIRGVTHSQAPFAPAASPSLAHSTDTQAGAQVSGQEQETAPPRAFPLSLHGSAWVPWSRDSLTRDAEWNLSPRCPPGERTRITNQAHCCTQRDLKTAVTTFILSLFWGGGGWGQVLLAVPHSTQGLSSLTGDQPRPPALGAWSLNHSSHKEIPCPPILV